MTDGPSIPTPPPPSGGTKSLFERVKDIIMTPKTEWGVIEREPSTIGSIFTGYVMILAAIGPVATIIGGALVGASMSYLIAMALVTYAISLILVFVNSLIIDALAPTFGGTKNNVQATKVAAYSATPSWLIGILTILPPLLPLAMLLGLVALVYCIYLLYLGLPQLMRVAQDKAVGYVIVVVAAWIIIYWVLLAVVMGMVLTTLGFGLMGVAARY